MALVNVEGEYLIVGSFTDEFESGSLTLTELQNRLTSLDLNNDEQVGTEARRCNNRCNGNEVEADVKVSPMLAGGGSGGDQDNPGETFRLAFKFEGE